MWVSCDLVSDGWLGPCQCHLGTAGHPASSSPQGHETQHPPTSWRGWPLPSACACTWFWTCVCTSICMHVVAYTRAHEHVLHVHIPWEHVHVHVRVCVHVQVCPLPWTQPCAYSISCPRDRSWGWHGPGNRLCHPHPELCCGMDDGHTGHRPCPKLACSWV